VTPLHSTPRYHLNTPDAIDQDQVPLWIQNIATQLDNTVMGFSQGTHAARPAGGSTYGKFYYETDTLLLFQYLPADTNNPLGWRQIGAMPTVPAARWYSNGQQQVQPPEPATLGGQPFPAIKIDWAFGPGSGWPGTYPNHWNGTSWDGLGWGPGPHPAFPGQPGIYRIHGQVMFYHLQPYMGSGVYRQQAENYLVWLYRHDRLANATGTLLGYWQVSDEYNGLPGTTPPVTVPFDLHADLRGIPDGGNYETDSIEVWAQSSVGGQFILTNVVMQTGGSSGSTYLEMEYVCAS
jgi:hypothetical protein